MTRERSLSPERPGTSGPIRKATDPDVIAEANLPATLESALEKLIAAAVRYDRDRDAVVMKAFEGPTMTPDVFREQFSRAFFVKLTMPEAVAVVNDFDKDGEGTVDGAEFLLGFFKRGFAEKSARDAERRRNEEDRAAARRRLEAERVAEIERKQALKVMWEYTKEDLESAMEKITEAAVKYDKNSPSAMSLSAFEGASMPPHVFKEQLKRVFNIKLTAPELGAVMKHFDKDGDGTVDCAEFLISFFKRGFETRNASTIAKREAEANAARKAQDALDERDAAIAAHGAAQVSWTFTDADKDSALAKITRAAIRYDKTSPSSMGLDGFEGASMEPHVFKEQLKRVFNLKLTPGELGALMSHFDKDGDHTIDCAEFLIQFFVTGFENKTEILRGRRKADEATLARARAKVAAKAAAATKWQSEQVSFEFTADDLATAEAMITEAAAKYDRNSASSMSLSAFDGASMAPYVFKEQLKRVFNLKLTKPQMGALMRKFDKDGDGTVDCSEFLLAFFKTSFEQKTAREHARKTAERDARAKLEAAARRAEADAAAKNALKVSHEFTPTDLDEALKQVERAALRYDKNSPSCMGLDAFEGASMAPHVFKEQLRRVFNLKLSPPQLGALMSHFDKDRDGTVDCGEFLLAFFKKGFETKSGIFRDMRVAEAEKRRRAAAAERDKLEHAAHKADAQIAPFTEADAQCALDQLIDSAVRYDRRTVGPGGLKGFEGASMSPTVFKEQLKRVFNIKLNPAQLGALVAYFDLDGDATVDCSEFLTQFFKIGLAAKGVLSTASDKAASEIAFRKFRRQVLFASKGQFSKKFAKPADQTPLGAIQRRSLSPDLAAFGGRSASPDGRASAPTIIVCGQTRAATAPSALPQPGEKLPYPQTADERLERRLVRCRHQGLDAIAASASTGGIDATTGEVVRADAGALSKFTTAAGHQLGRIHVPRARRLDLSAPACHAAARADEFRLSVLPSAVLQMVHLTELWLSNNPLGASGAASGGGGGGLPAAIGDLARLRVLVADGCGLTGVPAELGKLARLQVLRLDRNVIAALPSAAALCAFETPAAAAGAGAFDASRPATSSAAPASPAKPAGSATRGLAALQELSLGDNQLFELPPALAAMKALRWLVLAGNAIAELPPGPLAKLLLPRSLVALDLSRNAMEAAPAADHPVHALPQLHELMLAGNPFGGDAADDGAGAGGGAAVPPRGAVKGGALTRDAAIASAAPAARSTEELDAEMQHFLRRRASLRRGATRQ